MLFDDSVNNGKALSEWVNNCGIQVSSRLLIKQTTERGMSVYITNDESNGDNDSDGLIELIRCPRESTYNMYTLRETVSREFKDSEKDILGKCLRTIFEIVKCGESENVIGHILTFVIVDRKRDAEGKNASWERIGEYLKVLLNTKVGGLLTDQVDALIDFDSDFGGNIGMRCIIDEISQWEEVGSVLKEEFNCVDVREVLQIAAAVRSRVLEIPRSAADVDGDGAEEGGDEDDSFYVDTTLVPVLDYVNHDLAKRNANFDVDRVTKDVILYFDGKIEGTETEVYIAYDDIEDIQQMIAKYGFVPRSKDVTKYIEIPVLGYMKKSRDLISNISEIELTRRLFISGQSPNVQLAVDFDAEGVMSGCRIVWEAWYSFLIFSAAIDWDAWEEEDEENRGLDNDDEYEAYVRKYSRCEKTLLQMPEAEIIDAKQTFIKYLDQFLTLTEQRATMAAELADEYERPETESRAITVLLAVYAEIAHCWAERGGKASEDEDKDKHEEVEAVSANTDEAALGMRMAPLYNFGATDADHEEWTLPVKELQHLHVDSTNS